MQFRDGMLFVGSHYHLDLCLRCYCLN